jgi:hypothetical protein
MEIGEAVVSDKLACVGNYPNCGIWELACWANLIPENGVVVLAGYGCVPRVF